MTLMEAALAYTGLDWKMSSRQAGNVEEFSEFWLRQHAETGLHIEQKALARRALYCSHFKLGG